MMFLILIGMDVFLAMRQIGENRSRQDDRSGREIGVQDIVVMDSNYISIKI